MPSHTPTQHAELNAICAKIIGWDVRFEPSQTDKSGRYLCAVCSKDVPRANRGKAYKWNDSEICIGSFNPQEHPERRPSDYLDFQPTTNDADAFKVLEKCHEKVSVLMRKQSNGGTYIWWDELGTGNEKSVFGETLNLSIVKFAIVLHGK